MSRTQAKQPRDILHTAKKEVGSDPDKIEHLPAHTAAMITNSALQVTPHDSSDRQALIAKTAYRFAEERGFVTGHELDDWLAAEAQVDSGLMSESRAY